ncbi:hypothetical protein WMY93_027382 [Mugilogobius chulae]|uniref:Uncharacterized protein n=1 Tax=Mugilogobius chulae TaxID=88201 RepID=A0AAW0MSR2_9GOBI
MSISRKNWSALSSLARRWTMEDEEEVERERRRRVRESSSSADPENVFGSEHVGSPETGVSHGTALQDQVISSSVSISLDQSPSTSGRTTPMSPRSPTTPLSPRENWSAPRPTPSPVQNGHTHEINAVNGSSKFEPTPKPAFVRQSSRTISFRLMKKKEEETSPLQRSASVRIATKKFEKNTEQSPDVDMASSFQRNSRQRISSRSIQEKMERLAQAAQRSEIVRSPDVSQKTLSMMEEVSRKRGLFEQQQDQNAAALESADRSLETSKLQCLSASISGRIRTIKLDRHTAPRI